MTRRKQQGQRSVAGQGTSEGQGLARAKRLGVPYPMELRLRVMRAIEEGASVPKLSRTFGVTTETIYKWSRAYRKGGVEALLPGLSGPPRKRDTAGKKARRARVKALREEHPEYGTRRIQAVLSRFEGLGVSETEVRRILHEEGLMPETRPASEPHEHGPRRFERAEPNQLWQSDIFTFLLRRHERLYLVGFMDDHSRFIVAHTVAHHQRSSLVMEALRRGVAAYGNPHEVLTDQGRQYTAWRGSTEFEEELRREGIRHIKSRPQHPQTLGKIERFWKTLWDEFLSKTVFADFADCERRLVLFIDAYNFQRPHQALGGLVPADRYFRAAPQVRDAIERSVKENAMRLSLEQPTRKPFYLVGRLGDRDLTIAAAGSGLRVQVGDEEPKRIELPKEDRHEEEATPARIRSYQGEEGGKAQAPSAPSAAFSRPGGVGGRRGGAPPVSDDLERVERRASGDGGGGGDEDVATDVLSPGNPGTSGDARGAAPRGWRIDESGRIAGPQGGGARGEGAAARAGQAPERPAAFPDAASGETGTGDGGGGEASEAARPELDGHWEEAFEGFEARYIEFERLRRELDELTRPEPFDPSAYRGRALSWDRKLAGATAPHENRAEEGQHGAARAEAERVPSSAGGFDDARGPVATHPGGGEREDQRGGSSQAHGAIEKAGAFAGESGPYGDDRSDQSALAWPPREARAGEGARGGERGASSGEQTPFGASEDGGEGALGSVGHAEGADDGAVATGPEAGGDQSGGAGQGGGP